jgi:alpha,alpha-trehalose phosphorylase
MREYGGRLSFDPRLPRDWERLEFSLIVRGSRIDVDITHDEIGFVSHGSDELEVAVGGRDHQLRSGERVAVRLRRSS